MKKLLTEFTPKEFKDFTNELCETYQQESEWKTTPSCFLIDGDSWLSMSYGISDEDIKEHGKEMIDQIIGEGEEHAWANRENKS